MKNYYDELEVSKTSSKEIIEKVYKFLAKKYHPDTTKESNKQAAEEKFKAISEAYEILSDDEKRKKYDLELEQSHPTISYEEYIQVVNERDELTFLLNQLKNSSTTNINNHNIPNSNFSNTTNYQHTRYNNNNNNYTTVNSTFSKKRYYYTNTGKPASAFDSFKYKIKEFFTSLIILVLSILLAVLIVGMFTNFNFFNFLIK